MSDMPPPRDWGDLNLPDDAAFDMSDWDAPYVIDEPAPTEPTEAATLRAEDGWGWHDAALIALERPAANNQGVEFVVGAVDLYANANTGDLGGNYLDIARFDDLDRAVDAYQAMQGEVQARQLLPFQLADFAVAQAAAHGQPDPVWRSAGSDEYAAYEALQPLAAPDIPPADLDFDSLFDDLPEPTQDGPKPNFTALRELGITVEGADLDADPPPFIDPQTGTAYWIGVFQPDKDDPGYCVTSILTLGCDPESGEVEAQLAPCAPGDWDQAQQTAEYLLGMVEKGDMGRVFDAAEGMALATDQRALWEAERGIVLDGDAARDLADYSHDQWEVEL
jgi:hypothetical protein